MDLCSHSKVAIDFGSFAVDYHYPQTCPLGLVLCESGIRIVGFEVLNLLEVRVLLYGDCAFWSALVKEL
jgi:hypothetical protein